MLVIPSRPGKDTCDGITRREILRVGGSATLGISLADIFSLQKASAASNQSGGPGFGKAKSVIPMGFPTIKPTMIPIELAWVKPSCQLLSIAIPVLAIANKGRIKKATGRCKKCCNR